MSWAEKVLGLKKAVDETKARQQPANRTTCIHGDDNCIRCAANDLDNSSVDSSWRAMEDSDVRRVVYKLPNEIRELLRHHPGDVVLAGGFIRSVIEGAEPRDIDLFVNKSKKNNAKDWMKETGVYKYSSEIKENDQDWVVKENDGKLGLQVVWRYPFTNPHEILEQFDYTVTKSAIWFDVGNKNVKANYVGIYHERFYQDIARKLLTYANDRDSEYLLSIPRLIKYIQKGYHIDPTSLAALITKTCLSLDLSDGLEGIQKQLEKAYLLGTSDETWSTLTQVYVKPPPVREHYSSGS